MRTEEQERADRLAARARKKKGTRGKRQEANHFDFAAAVKEGRRREHNRQKEELEEQQHIEFQQKMRESINSAISSCVENLPKLGSWFVPRSSQGFHDIVAALKNKFRDTDFRWKFTDSGFLIAKPR